MASELTRLREQVKEQRALLRRSVHWIGVATGAMAAAHTASGEKGFSYPMRDAVTDSRGLARDISSYLEKFD